MRAITLKAHYDGKHICLDESYALQTDSKLIVMVMPEGDSPGDERQAWLAASQTGFARAYAEEEPDYSNALLRVDETNFKA